MKKALLGLLAVFYFSFAFSQHKPVFQKIQNLKAQNVKFQSFSPFTAATLNNFARTSMDRIVSSPQILNLDDQLMTDILAKEPDFLKLSIPWKNETLNLELMKVDIYTEDFSLILTGEDAEGIFNPVLNYRGVISGAQNSLAAITISENEIMGFIITEKDQNLVIGKMDNGIAFNKHILYENKDLKASLGHVCATIDNELEGYSQE